MDSRLGHFDFVEGGNEVREAKKGLPYMPWFVRDFLSATRGWNLIERAIYRELLDAQWELGILPESDKNLREICRASAREWKTGWARCKDKFPLVNGGGRRNEKLEQHRVKSLNVSEKRRSSSLVRWRHEGDANASPNEDSLAYSHASPNGHAKRKHPSPSPSEEKIKNPADAASDVGIEARNESELLAVYTPEPNAAEGGIDPDDYLIWRSGIAYLGEDKRSLMGRLVKTHGRDIVARKVGELLAMPDKPQDPTAYLLGALRKLERKVVF